MLELKECKMNHVELCAKINELREMEGNRKTIREDNLLTKIRKEVNILQELKLKSKEYFQESTYINSRGKEYPTFLISIKGLEWLRDNNIHDVKAYSEIIKELNPNYEMEHINIAPNYIRKELLIHKILLAWFDENQIKTQYPVLDYRLDYYIPDCYLIIEYDEESGHKDKEKDNKRMNEIIDYLYWNEFSKNPDVSYNEIEEYKNKKEDVIQVIRIKEFEEEKGLNELFEFLTGDVRYYSKLENLIR